jgi:hypothetical protein
MNFKDIDQKELKRLVASASLQKLSYLDNELSPHATDTSKVRLYICRLDETTVVSAVSSPELADEMLLAWSTGGRCAVMQGAKYEPEALVRTVFEATTAQEHNQLRMLVIPITSKLKLQPKLPIHLLKSAFITGKGVFPALDDRKEWKGQSETARCTAIAEVLAKAIMEPGLFREMLQDKLPNPAKLFDPFEL